MDGITVPRRSLGLSLTLALAAVTGAFTLPWERTNALQATRIELVAGVSRMAVQMTDLREDMVTLREDMVALRGEATAIREDVAALHEELRESVADLRREIREPGDLSRARETPGAGAQ